MVGGNDFGPCRQRRFPFNVHSKHQPCIQVDGRSPETIQDIVPKGAETVTEGTAQWMPVGAGLEVAAKTGTAEFCEKYPDCLDEDGAILTTHAWFTAFAPYQDPEIAVVVFIYGGGEGSITAMPVTAEILNYYFQLY